MGSKVGCSYPAHSALRTNAAGSEEGQREAACTELGKTEVSREQEGRPEPHCTMETPEYGVQEQSVLVKVGGRAQEGKGV